MDISHSQHWTFLRVQRGLDSSRAKLFRAQEQVASGKRLLRPSDDAVGTAKALSLRGRLDGVGRMLGSVDAARPRLQAAAGALERAGGVLAEARALVLQGLSGTLNASDRETLAIRVEELRAELLELANARSGDSYVFGGSRSSEAPFVELSGGGGSSIVYRGDGATARVPVGFASDVALGLSGSEVFARRAPSTLEVRGTTGAAPGASASQGRGFSELEIRHDATVGALGAGLALVAGGALDDFLGPRSLVVDAASGSARLGDGPAVSIPDASSPERANLVLTDEHGATLHLDFTTWTGVDESTTLSGEGTLRLGGASFVALDLSQADQRLIDPETGDVAQLDLRGVRRAGRDLVVFGGVADAFAVLDGLAADLRNAEGLTSAEVLSRLQARLPELDRVHEDVLAGLGTLGARLTRLEEAGARLADLDLSVRGLLSEVEDADLAQAALELARSEQTLQLVQATGVRLLQNSLLNYLR